MRRDWPRSAVAYTQTVADAFRSLDGVAAARRAEADPAYRTATVRPLLESLGTLALDPWGEEEEAAAAALAVREAGRAVLPWPLTHMLAVPPGARTDCDAVHLVLGRPTVLDHADVASSPLAVDVHDGTTSTVTVAGRRPAPLDPFGCEVRLLPRTSSLADALAMHLLLDAFWTGGALCAIADLALRHARERHQFGVPIGRFGEIRWRIADLILARDGLDELARYTWWLLRVGEAGPADVMALRVQMLESAQSALAHAHQILGAMGLCEEHDLAVIDRHLQPVLRRPAARTKSTALLAAHIRHDGFTALFPVPVHP